MSPYSRHAKGPAVAERLALVALGLTGPAVPGFAVSPSIS